MSKIHLIRETKISGTLEHVQVTGDITNEYENRIEVLVSQNVASELKNNDWRAGDQVTIPKELIHKIKK